MNERDIYRQQNFGNRIGFGRRSALLIVDFTVGFNDPKLFGGGNIDTAVKRTAELLAFFRKAKLPVAFTRVVYAEDFGTGLAPWLVQQGADTVVVTGCTTSGCVRASVVDALSHNFRPIVARDCVGDRALAPHEANLFDMGQKYADILERDDLIAALKSR